jgi:hypothetical protein
VFWFIRGVKRLRCIFHSLVGPVRVPQEARQDSYDELVFLNPVRSGGHVVHSSTSGA